MVHFVLKRDLFCPEAWAVLSSNVVCSVARCGPFCAETWSILSDGPLCPSNSLQDLQFDTKHGYLLRLTLNDGGQGQDDRQQTDKETCPIGMGSHLL